ncbi:hypothetical protein TVAG_053560 [Trichomonas vaginalis G3]|uniref:Surface antigen BspA-like n=1 Tax=Trichomonas vaginalis (strain ATCC PRA-98 / G3) TaxID=412133 RepID=A2EMV9_TRIV3|nr:hypothetical protein TVAGG3_0755460 [Trichomonas vaginalis G3]EAY06032.1 hypothetical protein TVAG_053560 [Trichomonas vaginalis G3]KAI5512834.1 hypothetical protein TVAGG3_0755460 [Trichomonas vaginalis G3]|eukprot:XP_001318255.1 hypothetical protein [Trichomonas vaginalis G3]
MFPKTAEINILSYAFINLSNLTSFCLPHDVWVNEDTFIECNNIKQLSYNNNDSDYKSKLESSGIDSSILQYGETCKYNHNTNTDKSNRLNSEEPLPYYADPFNVMIISIFYN